MSGAGRRGMTAGLGLICLAWMPGLAPALGELLPVPGSGAAARTLLVHNADRVAFSLADVLEMTALRLRRVAGEMESAALGEVTREQLNRADHLVVFCPEPLEDLPETVAEALMRTNLPVLWVGYGVEVLERLKPFAGQFHAAPPPVDSSSWTNVLYRSKIWSVPPTSWQSVILSPNGSSRMHMEFTMGTNRLQRPLAWSQGPLTVFGAVPWEGMLGHLFGDLVLDFYEVSHVESSRILLRIEDYHALSDHAKFQRMVDFLYAREYPFAVAVTPVVEFTGAGETADLENTPEFVQSLRYAQQRGGRLVVRGFLRKLQGAGEFWDLAQDRPLALDQPDYTRERLERAIASLVRHGLLPLAWETPEYAASQTAYAEIARSFSTGLERLQLSDATAWEQHTPSSLTRDRHGRLLVPENLGYVVEGARDPWAPIYTRAVNLLQLRQTVAGCSFHAYLPFDQFLKLMATLESLDAPFLDLLELDNRVQWSGGVILTGRARCQAARRGRETRWTAWDEQGRVVGSEPFLERSSAEEGAWMDRRGEGAVELFEFLGEPGEPKL